MMPPPNSNDMSGQDPSMDDESSEANLVEISDGTFDNNPQDGEAVDFTGSGTIYTKPDGTVCLKVTEIENVPVKDSSDAAQPDENQSRINDLKSQIRGKISSARGDNQDEGSMGE